jgi:electron transfer flavoprotein beta subunit
MPVAATWEDERMRIVVCLKQMRHVFRKTGRDHTKNFISESDEVSCINPFDESALELALCMKDVSPDVEVILLTLGPVTTEIDLRRCLAMGADELWQIETDDHLDGWSKSLLLADAVKELKGTLVLCGEKSMDSQNGQIGPFMAFHLAVPFVPRVTDITVSNPGLPVSVERNSGRGKREIIECGLPAIFSAAIGPKSPRYPRFEDKRKLEPLPIQKLSPTRKEMQARVTLTGTYSPRPRPKQVVPPDSSLPARQRITQLLRGSSIEKKGEMIMGEPEHQVDKIIAFLQAKEFLEVSDKER